MIIFSVTRTAGSYRFPRAKDRIIIVGDTEYAKGNELLAEIMNYCTVKYDEL